MTTWMYTVPVVPEEGVAAAVPPVPLLAAELLLLEAEPEGPVVPAPAVEVLEVLPEVAPPAAAGSVVALPVPVDGVVLPFPPVVAVPTAAGDAVAVPVSPPAELEPAPEDPVGPDCAAPDVVLVPVPELPPWAWPVLSPLVPVPVPVVRADSGVEELAVGVVRVAAVVVLVSANAVRPVTACTATKISTAAPTAAAILAAILTNRDTMSSLSVPNSTGTGTH